MIRRRSVAQQPKDVFKGYSASTAHDIVMIFTLFDNLMAGMSTKYVGRARQFSNRELLFGRGDPSGFLLKYRFETVGESQGSVFCDLDNFCKY